LHRHDRIVHDVVDTVDNGVGERYGLGTGLVSDSAWRRLPAALAAVLGVVAVTASISIAAQLHLDLAGLGVPALVVGLTLGGNAAHALTSGTLTRANH